MESIFHYINRNIQKNGTLPENFNLDSYRRDYLKGYKFVDGAEDGIMLYHMNVVADKTFVEKVTRALIKLKENNIEQICQEIEDLYDEMIDVPIKTFPNIDKILQQIQKNIKKIEIKNILKLGICIILNTCNIEMLKFAITLFELVDISSMKEIVEIIEKLALCEEFTLYAVHVIEIWDNANEVIFMLAKKMDGWGKIHLVTKLEPRNENIKEWLITDGCNNRINPGYLAGIIANKINLIHVLHQKEINKKQFNGISIILEGLLEEDNPYISIESIENTTEIFESYLAHFKNFMDDIRFYNVIVLMSIFLYHKKQKSEEEEYIFLKIGLLLGSQESIDTLRKQIEIGDSKGLKIVFKILSIDENIDLKREVYQFFIKDPFNSYDAFAYLITLKEYKKEVISLMEDSRDFKSHYEMPAPILFSNNRFDINLVNIIQIVGNYPFLCNNIVASGLLSKVMMVRNASITTIQKWKKLSQKEINTFPDIIVNALKKLQKTEMIKSYKEKINQLLGIEEDLSNYKEPEIVMQETDETNYKEIHKELYSDELDLLFPFQIVLRGKEYYKNNMIYSFLHSNNKYITYVQGSQFGTEYEVEIEMNGTIIEAMKCNCPYQNYCKHEYATILWLRDKLRKDFDKANNINN